MTYGNHTREMLDEHGAGALHLAVDDVDAVHKAVAHVDEQGHEFGGVDVVGTHLTEVHTLVEQLLGYIAQVVDLGHRHHGITAQMGVD